MSEHNHHASRRPRHPASAGMSGTDLGRLALEVARSAVQLARASGAPEDLVAEHEGMIARLAAAGDDL